MNDEFIQECNHELKTHYSDRDPYETLMDGLDEYVTERLHGIPDPRVVTFAQMKMQFAIEKLIENRTRQ